MLRRSLIALVMAVSALGAATAGALAAEQPTTAAACAGHWPASVQGVPSLYRAGAAAGDYLWHSSTGWHLRVTHPGTKRAVFSGRIVSDRPLAVQAIRLEGGDFVALSADRKTITYRFVNYGRVDGLNFQTGCARKLTFTGNMNGSRLSRSLIWIGAKNVHPLQNLFSVTRVA